MVSALSGNDRAVIKELGFFLKVTFCHSILSRHPTIPLMGSPRLPSKPLDVSFGCGCWVVNPLWLRVF